MEALEKLKFVGRVGTGVDNNNVDKVVATEKNIIKLKMFRVGIQFLLPNILWVLCFLLQGQDVSH
jgi:hypothetical protein